MIFTKEEMKDLLITAIEGGSNYWYNLPDLTMIKRTGKNLDGLALAEKIFLNLYLDKSLKIPVSDIEGEDDDENLGFISYVNLLRADEVLKNEENKWIIADVKSENWDASTADVWFQLVVLGEVVYG